MRISPELRPKFQETLRQIEENFQILTFRIDEHVILKAR